MGNLTLVDLAENGQLPELRQRLDAGADVNLADPDGRVALHAAFAEGELEIVMFLLERGANPRVVDASGAGVLHWAARSNRRAMLDVAHEVGKEAVDVVDLRKRSPLSWAAQGDDLIAMDWLLEKGADPNGVDFDGWAPLHYAAANGNVDSIRRLLRAGARALIRLRPSKGEDYGHLASDLARHYAPHQTEALLLLEAAEATEPPRTEN